MKPKLFLTRELPEEGMKKLSGYFDMEYNSEDRVLSKQEIIAGISGKDALLCLLTDTIDREVIESNPNLKVISNYAVGYNNIDVKAATELGIPVCNTPGVLTETTADLAWALIMAAARRITEGDRFVRAGKFKGWGPLMLLGGDVFGKTLGIVGMGRIGLATARRAKGFGMRILYTNRSVSREAEEELRAKKVELSELLSEADIVSIHVPLTEETRHLIGEKELAAMKPSAILVNTARGPVVDESALVEALRSNRIRAAGLDVYENEPEVHPGLFELENVVLLPHLGSATIETRTKMALMAAENAIAVFERKTPAAIVNPEVLS
ncbi:MAG: D-glycerate dehydrogenase [Candidatus Dadabacteria bacterium]|nr:MAG: D-glycerate dehydrogenase [Candidatus Dadabacteria bacterium]